MSTLFKALALIGVSLLKGMSIMLWCAVYQTSFATPMMEQTGALDSPTSLTAGLSSTPSSSYFNPAALSFAENHLTFGVVALHQSLDLSYNDRPSSADVSREIYSATPINSNANTARSTAPLPTAELRPRSLAQEANQQLFINAGMTKVLWPKRITLGFTALIPTHRFELQSPSFVDERAQYYDNQLKFERWGDALEGLSTSVGLGVRLAETLSIGMGVTLLNRAIASSQVFLSDASYEGLSVISPKVEVYSSLSPNFSLMWRQNERIRNELSPTLFLSVFASESVEVEGKSLVKIWNYPYPEGESSIVQRFTQTYRTLPMRIRWGAELPLSSIGLSTQTWSIFTGGVWARWSQYTDRVAELAKWSDQVELSGGFKWRLDHQQVAMDCRWRPSPVPEQNGRSSYVDPHQIALALHTTIPILKRLHIGVSLQGHYLVPRTDLKSPRALSPVIDEFSASVDNVSNQIIESSAGLQTNNPGYPGYKSWGWVWVGGLNLVWYDQ
jgi:long-chain fatty acid transport protein